MVLLAPQAGGGDWAHGVHQDGWFRRSLPFEPLCNCPMTGGGESGLLLSYSQMWMSAVMVRTPA